MSTRDLRQPHELPSDTHGEDPLLGDDFPGISNIYDGHITIYAGRFTGSVIEQIRRLAEVILVKLYAFAFCVPQRMAGSMYIVDLL